MDSKIEKAKDIIDKMSADSAQNIKIIKKEKGLIERQENNDTKIILAEDNRQVIFG